MEHKEWFRDERLWQDALRGTEKLEFGNQWLSQNALRGQEKFEFGNDANNSFYNCLDSRSSSAKGQCLRRRSAGLQEED